MTRSGGPHDDRPGRSASRPWVRARRLFGFLGRSEEAPPPPPSPPPAPAGPPSGVSAWEYYVERARGASASAPSSDDFDTVEVVFEEYSAPPLHAAPSGSRSSDRDGADDAPTISSVSRRTRERGLDVDDEGASGPEGERHGFDAYPPWFDRRGLVCLLAGDMAAAARYYKACLKRAPDSPEGWYGTAALSLERGRWAEAATAFVRGWQCDRGIPIGRYLQDLCMDAPDAWYSFAGALVEMRRKSAYECADLVLAAVALDSRSPHALRQRATRVRQSLAEALATRAQSDALPQHRRGRSGLGKAVLQSVVIVMALAAMAGVAVWFATLYRTTSGGYPAPMPSVTAAAPLAEPSSATGAREPSAQPSRAALSTPGSAQSPSPTGDPLPTATSEAATDASPWPSASAPSSSPSDRDTAPAGEGSPLPAEAGSPAAVSPVSPAASPSSQPEDGDATVSVTDDHGNGHMVKIDGTPAGLTPLTLFLHPGRAYTITVAASSGRQPWTVRLRPAPGESQHVEAVLTP